MSSLHQVSFKISCSIGHERVVALTFIDKKNNSVHLHLYRELFDNKRSPIQVKNSDMELTEGKESELITKILTDHFSDENFQINTIEKLVDMKEVNIPGNPLKIIVRLKGYR